MAIWKPGYAVLSLADDPSQALIAFTSDWQETTEVNGAVRMMANGRRRIVRQTGGTQRLSWTMPLLTKEQVRLAKVWQGRTVLIRDTQGRAQYGVYFGLSVQDYKSRDAHAVTFSLEAVSFSDLTT